MGTIRSFEELECWNLSKSLTIQIYSLILEDKLRRDVGFCEQIKRAAISTMNNIAEGFSRYSHKEMIRYFDIAFSSCAEVRSMLYLAYELNYIDKNRMFELQELSSKTQAKTKAFIAYLSKHKNVKT